MAFRRLNCPLLKAALRLCETGRQYLSANVVKGFCKEEIYKGKSAEVIREKYPQKMLEKMKSLGVSEELILWYHIDTLNELLQLYELASSDQDIGMLSARKYALALGIGDFINRL